jgi:hypothetical protein
MRGGHSVVEENRPLLARVVAQVVATYARGGFTWHTVTAVAKHEQSLTVNITGVNVVATEPEKAVLFSHSAGRMARPRKSTSRLCTPR